MTVPLFETRPKVAFLDWDGTFCDSRESIYGINLILAEHYGKVMPSYQEWLKISHPGVEQCMSSLGITDEAIAIKTLFHGLLIKQNEEGLQNPLYPGTTELLTFFQQESIPAVIISRHPEHHLIRDIEAHGLTAFFHSIIGEPAGNDGLKKDEVLQELCLQFEVARHDTFYLGDTTHDMVLAEKAGVVPIAVTHGYEPRTRLEKESRPTLIVDSLGELLDYL